MHNVRCVLFAVCAFVVSCGSSKSASPAPTPTAATNPSPAPSPAPVPSPVPVPSPSPDPAPAPSPSPDPSPAPSPVGQKAHYQIVTARTSAAVKSGTLDLSVIGESKTPDAFDVNIAYDFDVQTIGHKQGAQVAPVPKGFFTQDFVAKLKAAKTWKVQNWTATYLGTEDVTTESGTLFRACDKITISNLPQPLKITEALELLADSRANGETVQMTIFVTPSIPVFGAARVDLQTNIGPLEIKVGGDYAP